MEKAKERPDQVKKVVQKAKEEGLFKTWQQIKTKLSAPMSLGYSSSGIVIECGRGVHGLHPGDSVASNGPHAEFVTVPANLTTKIPKNVTYEQAAYTVVSSIAMQGLRLGKVEVGEKVCVIGLGLIGQLTALLLKTAGCKVFGCDLNEFRLSKATSLGITATLPDNLSSIAHDNTQGHGFDAVFLAASSPENSPIELAAHLCRKKGRIISIGQTKLDVPRREFYFKELSLKVSCSYGPGRYDPEYEQKGKDYPFAYVRWTEKRNMEAVLELMAQGIFQPEKLTTHNHSFKESLSAFEAIGKHNVNTLGIVLHYSDWSPISSATPSEKISFQPSRKFESSSLGYAMLGAGNFASMTLMPVLNQIQDLTPVVICSAKGLNAVHMAKKWGFKEAVSDPNEVMENSAVEALIIATRHYLHIDQAVESLSRGIHTYIEKPLALNFEDLHRFITLYGKFKKGEAIWTVGFNRRHAPLAQKLKSHLSHFSEPLCISYRINAGSVPHDSWIHDPEIGGGQIVGEACHMIDFCAFLASSPIVEVFAHSSDLASRPYLASDRAAINLRFGNGSIASIQYYSGGDKSYEKERIEVMGSNTTSVLKDFHSLEIHQNGKTRKEKTSVKDKGHKESLRKFFEAIKNSEIPPIPYQEIFNSSEASLAAVESMQTGQPQTIENIY